VLGWVTLAEGNYGEARKWLEQAATAYREMEYQWGAEYLPLTLAALARAEHGLGLRREAQVYLVEALESVLEIGAYIPLLFLIPIVPVLLTDAGEVERAVGVYALAERHAFVSNSLLFEDIAGRHIETAAAALAPEVVKAAQARGRARDVWATVAELLEGLSKLGGAGPRVTAPGGR